MLTDLGRWFSLPIPVASAQLQLEPLTAAVLLGSRVSFNCSVASGTAWTIMTWNVADVLVLTITEIGVDASEPRYEARNVSTGATNVWEFSIAAARRSDSGPVVCTVQGLAGTQTAQLSVQGGWITDDNNNNNNNTNTTYNSTNNNNNRIRNRFIAK